MNKRMNFLVAGIVLISLLTMAFDTVPSITTGGLYSGSSDSDDPSITVSPDAPEVQNLLEQINQFLEGEKPVSDFFDGQQAAMQAALPEGASLEDLALQELASLDVSNYTPNGAGGLDVTLKFPTKFDPDKPVLVMIGLMVGDEIIWEPFPAEVDEDGNIKLLLSDEQLLKIQAGNAVIAVLS